MLLHAAGDVACLARTCCTQNFLQEGEATSLTRHGCFHSRFFRAAKQHQHVRRAHCYLSTNAHFAYVNHFSKMRARRYALLEMHRIPAGLLQARKHRFRKTFAITAVKYQDTSQQGETSKEGSFVVYKAAVVSSKGVKADGITDKIVSSNGDDTSLDSAYVLNTHTTNSAKGNSNASGSRNPTKLVAGGIDDLKNWWRALHKVYHADSAMWGYGSSPIFTVYEGPDGKIEKVLIDEKEIQRRQGVEPLLPGLGDGESKAQAGQKIMLAQSIAKDLEMGKIDFDRSSTIFTFIKHPSKIANQTGHQKLLSQIDFAVHKAAPVLRSVFMIAIPLYGICVLFGAYLLVTNRSEEDISKEEKAAASLEKMRKLKAQMSTHRESAGAGQATLAPADFMQKLLEVREMARKVRLEEGLKKSVKDPEMDVEEYQLQEKSINDSDIDVEEYQPQEQSVIVESILMVENDDGTMQNGIGHEDAIDATLIEPHVLTMDNMGAMKSENNVIDATIKPPPKIKPRIITSLDEAMAIIESKETITPNGMKSSPDLNGTASIPLSDKDPEAAHESVVISRVHYDNLIASLNGLNNLQSSVPEKLPSKVDDIPSTSLGVQERVGETQSIMSCEIEVPHSGMHQRPKKMDTGTMDRLVSEGQAKGPPSLDPKFQRYSGDLPDSAKTAPLHLFGEKSENGPVNGKYISSSVRPSEVNNSAQRPFKSMSDQLSCEVLPSAHSEGPFKKYSPSTSSLNFEIDEVVGSGQPLRRSETHSTSSEPMSNTKRWSKELQRKYDLERDPETRELMKEIGSELDSWITEEEIEEVSRLVSNLEEEDDDVIQKHYEKLGKKIKVEKEKFGLEAVLEKYKEYQPKPHDELWWLDLRSVLCLMVVSAKQEGEGLYGLDMTIDSEGMRDQIAWHVIAFEDRKDASNFCRLLELRSGSRFQFAEVCPFSPKKLFEVAKEEGFKVTVLRSGEIQTNVDQTLEEVEDQILEIGRSVYWEKMDRDRSIDIDSILHQRFGL